MNQFIPSQCSHLGGCHYGCGSSLGNLGDDAAAEAPPAEEGSSKSSVEDYIKWGTMIFSALTGESDDRMSAAEIQGKLEYAKQAKLKGYAPPLTAFGQSSSAYWSKQITQLTAELEAANQIAGEARTTVLIDQARNVAYTAIAFAGVLVVGGVALTLVQRARLTQAEIRKLRRESSS